MKFRAMIYLAFAMGTATLWCRSSATDMEFRIAPVEIRDMPFEFLTGPRADIPIPQFFRIVIDKHKGVLVLEDPFVQKITLTPLPHLDLISTLPTSPEQSRHFKYSRTPARYLSGIEILLLHHTETAVETPKR